MMKLHLAPILQLAFIATLALLIFQHDTEIQCSYVIDTVAGYRYYAPEGGIAQFVALNSPSATAFDSLGNLYIADTKNHRIRMVDTRGFISTVVGNGTGGYSGDGSMAASAQINGPVSIAFSANDDLYISDTGNHCIRKVDSASGKISTVAGMCGVQGFGGDDGVATMARFNYPRGISIREGDGIFVADSMNDRIRKVSLTQDSIVSTVAGDGQKLFPPADGVSAVDSSLNFPSDVSIGTNGDLFIADMNNYRVRRVDNTGIISTYAGSSIGDEGDNGPATSAKFTEVQGLFVDSNGDLFICLPNSDKIRKVDSSTQIISTVIMIDAPHSATMDTDGHLVITQNTLHQVRRVSLRDKSTTIVAGTGVAAYASASGIARDALLSQPSAIAVDLNGDILVASTGDSKVRKIDHNGIITNVAGSGSLGYDGDHGDAVLAMMNNPSGVAVSTSGDIYISDSSNNVIRKVNTSGIITTVVGDGSFGYSGDGGNALLAALYLPLGVAVGKNGDLYFADSNNNVIRKVSKSGIITTVAGDGNAGYAGDEGSATQAQLDYPIGIAISDNNDLYIADSNNNRIRKVDSGGTITTIAGDGNYDFYGDGSLGTRAALAFPTDVTIGSNNDKLYIVDSDNGRIRMMDIASGIISTVAGGDMSLGVLDNVPATNTSLQTPWAMAANKNGELLIIEESTIRKVDANHIITTVAGLGESSDFVKPKSLDEFLFVSSIAVLSSSHELIVADSYNNCLKKVDMLLGNSTVIAGNEQGTLSDNIDALNATLSTPRSVVISNGDIYFADFGNHCVRRIDRAGVIHTTAGICGVSGYSGDGAQATSAKLSYPSSVAIAPNGDIYVADFGNHVIRMINQEDGTISRIAGLYSTPKFYGEGIPAINSNLYNPSDLTVAPNGDLYVSDHGNHCVRKVDTNEIIVTVAGQCGTPGEGGDGDSATRARLMYPRGIALSNGVLTIADYGNSCLRQVKPDGTMTTIAGQSGVSGYFGEDGIDGNHATLFNPTGVTVDGSTHNIYIADFGNHLVRVLVPTCFGESNNDVGVCSGNGQCISSDLCECNPGYEGHNCATPIRCYDIASNDTRVCSGHGDCFARDNCSCHTGFSGTRCEEVTDDVQVDIEFDLSQGLFFNIQSVLRAGLAITPIERSSDFSFKWTISEVTLSGSKLLNISDMAVDETDTNSPYVVLKPNVLESRRQYELTITVSYVSNPDNTFSRSYTFNSSIAPDAGSFNISPHQGRLLVDSFIFSAPNWKPTESVATLEYRFGYVDPSKNETAFINSFSPSSTLTAPLPNSGRIIALVEGRSASGHSLRQTIEVLVKRATSQELATYIENARDALATINGAALESNLTILCSSMESIVEVMGEQAGASLGSDLVDLMTERKEDISTEKKVQNIKLLSDEMRLFDRDTINKLSNLLTDTMMHDDSIDVLDQAIVATENFAKVLASEKSDKEQRLTFVNLLEQVSNRTRSRLYEGQQAHLSMDGVEVVMSKPGTINPNTSLVIPNPSPDSTAKQKSVIVSVSAGTIGSSYVQGQILANPPEAYDSKCSTRLVSPTISVQLYTQTQQRLERVDNSVPIVSTTVPVSDMDRVVNSTSYSFICKFYIAENATWIVDTSVCRTLAIPDSSSVNCLCTQPVTHAVSLDYVQSASTENEKRTSTVCDNPCGCTSKKTLQSWAKALIGLAVAFVCLLLLVLACIVIACTVRRVVVHRRAQKEEQETGSREQHGREMNEI